MSLSEKIKAAQQRRKEQLDKVDAMLNKAKEASEGLTEDQDKEITDLTSAAEATDKEIADLVQQEQRLVAAAERTAALRNAPDHPGIRNLLNNGGGAPYLPHGGDKRWTIPATARRHQSVTNFACDAASGGMTKEEKAYRFGAFCLAKAQMDCPGVYNFPQATKFAREHGLLNAAHMEGGSDTTGSHVLVPEEFGMDMIKLRESYGVARQICKVRNMSSDTRTDPKWQSGLTAYHVGENAAGTTSTQQLSTVRLTAKKIMAIATYSSELSEDSVIDIGNDLAGEISYAFALKEDQDLIDGDGTANYGGIVGLKSSFSANLTLGTAPGYRDATGTSWGAITLADITTLISVVPVYAQAGMYFLCSSQFYYQVMVPLLNAAGGVTGTELQNGFRRPLWQGIPVMFSQVMPIATATSGIMLMLGNFAAAVTFGDRRRETFQFSRDATVDSVSLFTNDLIAIRGTERIDINVHSYGSNTVCGPIAALATA